MAGLSSSPSQWSRPQDLSSCSMKPELSYWRGSFHSIESSSQAPAHRPTSNLRPPPQSGAPILSLSSSHASYGPWTQPKAPGLPCKSWRG